MKKTKKSSVKKTSDGRRGGLLVGPTDKEGGKGIPATVIGGRNVILGGNEVIINENAALLHCEELDKINQSTGGRSIDCGLQKRSNTHTTMAGGGGMYWMGNEGDRVVVDKSGQGDFTSYYLIREKSPHDMVSMSFDSRFEAEKYAKRRKMVLVDKYVDAKGTVENKKTGKAIIVSYEKDKDVKNQVGLAIENIIYPYDYKITKGDKSFDFPKKKTVYFYKITPKNEGDMEKIVGSLGVLVSSKKILSIYQDSTDKYAGGGMADGEIDKASDSGSLNSFQELAKKYNGGGKLSDSISDIKDGEIRVFTENIKKLLSFVGEGMDIDFYPNQNEVVIQFTENAWGGINVDTWNRVDSLLKNLEGKNGFSEFQLNPSHNKILLVFENGNNEIGLY